MKIVKRFLCVATACLILLSAITLAACSGEEKKELDETGIASVRLDKKGETVELEAAVLEEDLEAYKGDVAYLLALDTPFAPLSDDTVVLDEAKVKEKMKFSFPLCGEDGISLISRAFTVAIKDESTGEYVALTSAAYIENPEAIATASPSAPKTYGIKGVSGENALSAAAVGAEHTLVTAKLDELILTEYREGAVSYLSDGITYYFDGEAVERLDAEVEAAAALGMRAYMRTVLTYPEGEGAQVDEFLYCKGASAGSRGYMPNLYNDKALEYVSVFYEFLGSRYSGGGRAVCDYIIGENVNDYEKYCDVGIRTEDDMYAMYSAWVRIAYNRLRSENGGAGVYLSMDNSWGSDAPAVSVRSKKLLSQFEKLAREHGDYPWSIALSLGDADDISSVVSGSAVDYSILGAESFSQLFDLLEDMKCGDASRRVIIDSLSIPQSVSEKNRAAYYTYTYYCAAKEGVSALVYSSKEGFELCTEDGECEDLYYAAVMCGSDMYSQLKDYTSRLEYAIEPDFSGFAVQKLTYRQSAESSLSDSVLKNKDAFPKALSQLEISGGAYNNEMFLKETDGENKTRALKIYADASKGAAAVASFDIASDDVIGSAYLAVTLDADFDGELRLMIFGKGSSYASYVCETALADGRATYYFNVTSFAEDVSADALDLVLTVEPEDVEGEYTFDVDEITLYGSSGADAGAVWVIVIVALVAIALVGLFVFLAMRRKKVSGASSAS